MRNRCERVRIAQVTLLDHRLPLRLLPVLLLVAFGTGGMCPLPPDAAYGRPCAGDDDCGDEHRCGSRGSCVPRAAAADAGERDGGHAEDAGEPGDGGEPADGGQPGDAGEPSDAGEAPDGGPAISEVEPLFPGLDSWHDYVKRDGSERCDGTEGGRYGGACLHAGVARRVRLAALTSCDDVVVSDALDALSWECREDGGEVSVVSTDLAPGKRLLDLVDPLGPAFRPNHVIVQTPAFVLETAPALWWSDPVVSVSAAQSLSEPGTVYVLAGVVSALSLDASSIALVMPPGTRVAGSGEVLRASGRRFLWLEGDVQGTASAAAIDDVTVRLEEVSWSAVRHLGVRSAALGAALHVSGGNALLLREVQVEGAAGLQLHSASAHTLKRVDVADASVGLTLRGVTDLLIDDGVISNVGVGDEGGDAVSLEEASGNVLTRLLVVGSRDDALSLTAASQNVFRHLTAILNNDAGVRLRAGSDGNYFEGLALVNNGIGVAINDSVGNHFGDVAALHSGVGVQLNTPLGETVFFGDLRVGGNGTACAGAGAPAGAGGPFTTSACTAAAEQPFTLVEGLSAAGAFVGHVQGDAVNPTPSATPGYAEIADWTRFENRTRTWVPSSGILSSGSRGRCRAGEDTCYLTDFGLLAPSGGAGTLFGVLPSPLDALTTWEELPGGASVVRHLLELGGDGDGRCEDGERCLAMPHIGAYPGHGELEPVGAFLLDDGGELHVESYATPGY